MAPLLVVTVATATFTVSQTALTDLAESPFMRADGGGSGSNLVRDALTQRQRLEALEAESRANADTIAQLQATVRAQQLELAALRREKGEVTDAHDRLRDEFDRVKSTAGA